MFDNKGEIDALKLVIDTLRAENEHLRARLTDFELDERETRRGLLTRLGVLPPAGDNGGKKTEPKPIRKVTVPWHLQAAKLEADSRERYWKKQIEDREKPQEQRKAEAESKVSESGAVKSEQEQMDEDIEELSK